MFEVSVAGSAPTFTFSTLFGEYLSLLHSYTLTNLIQIFKLKFILKVALGNIEDPSSHTLTLLGTVRSL